MSTSGVRCVAWNLRIAVLLFAVASTRLYAQQPPVQALSTASIAVTVKDIHGSVVPHVAITLISQSSDNERSATTDDAGAFLFTELPAGNYRLKVVAEGMAPLTSPEILVNAGEIRQLPITAMDYATSTTTVNVSATLKEVAEEQVSAQEKQRVGGILPNYYVSYVWAAAPMTPRLKFRLALRSAFDPATVLTTAAIAGAEHAHKTFPGYGQEMEGYAKRFGATYSDTLIGTVLGKAILPTLLHQDPRYFYRGSGTTTSRAAYAISQAILCRGDNGRLQLNYSALLGQFGAAALSNLYRAPRDRQLGTTARNGMIVIGSGAIVNLLREFLSRDVTANVPVSANGKQ